MSEEAEERQRPTELPEAPPVSSTTTGLWQVFAPCIAFAGVQASWAIQIGHSSAELRRLGVSDENIGLVWLAGPISGVIVQPIVGVLSDRCTSRYGRRRP
jgi:solute carrier family 45, member 1/2/4